MSNIMSKSIEELIIDKSDWKIVKFGDIAIQQKTSVERENTNLKRYVKGEHMASEDLHLRDWGNLEDEYLGPAFTRYFEKGDILYGTRRTYLRKVVVAPFEGITSTTTFVIKANEALINKNLLPFLMMSEGFTEHSIKNSKGSVNPYVNWKDLANYEFLLPPKDQQAQLSELLWAMDEVIEKTLNVLEKIGISRESTFKNLVETSEGELKPLSKILVPKKGKSSVPHKREKYIGLEHIVPGAYECTKYSNTLDVQAQCNIVDEGDLCYSKLRPYLDKVFIATFNAVSTTELLIYDSKEVSKEYILFHLHSKPFIDYVSGKGFGTKMPRVSHKIIGEFQIKVPEDEKEILRKMNEVKKSNTLLVQKISSSKSLQKSIINQVF